MTTQDVRTVAVLGATGSVGTQALDVCAARGYRVDLICAHRSVNEMETLARRFLPRVAVMTDEAAATDLRTRLSDTSVTVLGGEAALLSAIADTRAETVIHAILGAAGLRPTLAVIDAGRRLALANKESLVIAGDIVMQRARARGVEILPVDSEHCAIFQSLLAGGGAPIRRLILTASGGPFFGYTREQLRDLTAEQTLRHPTWRMGRRITVDSATLMNKGFEVIEAAHLFSVPVGQIEVVVHRESILHSAVEYTDHTVIGEMSVPDMRMCVQYAVDFPARYPSASEPLDFVKLGQMTFFAPDRAAFPLLSLAERASALGGGMGAVLNAADEVAVEAHLCGRLSFGGVADCVLDTFERMAYAKEAQTVDERLELDRLARAEAARYLTEHR